MNILRNGDDDPTPLPVYWAATVAYELGHKFWELGDRKARIQNPDWHAYRPFDKPEPSKFERSRPLVTSERVLVTAMAMAWGPLFAPLHLAGDIIEMELWLRGIDRNETTFLLGWESAMVL